MRTSILVLTGLLWALPALCSSEALLRVAKLMESPVGRFVLRETSEGARVLELIRGRSPMKNIMAELETRVASIDRKFRAKRVRGGEEVYSQLLLRRIVREELQFLGTGKVEFVPSDPMGSYAQTEEIFLNAYKREVINPNEIFDNLALNTDTLRIGMTQLDTSSSYALEMWMAETLTTFSQATGYLKKALPVALWEAELAQSQLPLARVHRAAHDLRKLQGEIEAVFAKLDLAKAPALTDGMKQGLAENSAGFRDIYSQIFSAKPL